MNYIFLNIHPLGFRCKIVPAWHTKSSANENICFIACKMGKSKVDSYFDLFAYRHN